MVDWVALGQFCVGLSGNGTVLSWTEWHLDRIAVDWVAPRQSCGGPSGTGTFMVDWVAMGHIYGVLNSTATELWWTVWRWDRFMVDWVALGHIYGGLSGNGTDLWWTELHWDKFMVDWVALGQSRGGLSSTGAYFSTNFEDFPHHSSVHKCSVFMHVTSGGLALRPLQTAVPHRHVSKLI